MVQPRTYDLLHGERMDDFGAVKPELVSQIASAVLLKGRCIRKFCSLSRTDTGQQCRRWYLVWILQRAYQSLKVSRYGAALSHRSENSVNLFPNLQLVCTKTNSD